jgi:hypothetical protein
MFGCASLRGGLISFVPLRGTLEFVHFLTGDCLISLQFDEAGGVEFLIQISDVF